MNGTIRELSADEVTSLVLPLRVDTLHRELHWVHHEVRGAESLRDRFDATSIHLGFFGDAGFAGTFRLVVCDDVFDLPSGPHLAAVQRFGGRCAEISKLVVDAGFRNRGVRTGLIAEAFKRAAAKGVGHLFVGATSEFAYYSQRGFTAVGERFQFTDEHVRPPSLSQMFHAEIQSESPGQ